MRLTEEQIQAIVEETVNILGSDGELFLYGSRADDSLKGGDIDLVYVLDSDAKVHELSKKIAHLLAAIKVRIGEQRIDFSIIKESQITSDPFWKIAFNKAVRLG
jgi:uncharacterized protein